jgi:hypothetical protein
MSLIFDRFPRRKKAEAFLRFVKETYGLDGQVFDDEQTASYYDPFPSRVDPPIVHINRPMDLRGPDRIEVETLIIEAVSKFGGTFAGT